MKVLETYFNDKVEQEIYGIARLIYGESEVVQSLGTIYKVYMRQRTVIKVTLDAEMSLTLTINGNRYTADSNGILYYDCTDELRVQYEKYQSTGATKDLYLYIDDFGLYLQPIQGKDPELLNLPPAPFFGRLADDWEDVQIAPPSVIYAHRPMSYVYPTRLQLFGSVVLSYGWFTKTDYNGTWSSLPIKDGAITFPTTNEGGGQDTPVILQSRITGRMGAAYPITVLDGCERVCALRWLSESGVYKQAIWRMKQVKKSSSSRNLLPIADEYHVQRSETVEFTAYIEGLDAYSYAYYADIITSPDVHCSTYWGYDESKDKYTGEDLTGYETRAEIGTTNYTQPDGDTGRLQTLEIVVKQRHYDTI